jgi:hypothetical protein
LSLAAMASQSTSHEIYLKDRRTYVTWFLQLKFRAEQEAVWQFIDPDQVDAPVLGIEPQGFPPTHRQLMEALNLQRGRAYASSLEEWQAGDQNSRGPAPLPPVPATYDDIKEEHAVQASEYKLTTTRWTNLKTRFDKLQTWIYSTVHPTILSTAQLLMSQQGRRKLQDLVRILKSQYGPTDMSMQNTATREYRAVLKQAEASGTNPTVWIDLWRTAYYRCKSLGIPDVEGWLGAQDFLNAIHVRMNPEWASLQLSQLVQDQELGNESLTIEQLAAVFAAHTAENALRKQFKGPQIFATLGPRSDSRAPSPNNSGGGTSGSPGNQSVGNDCPCTDPNAKKHTWAANECWKVEHAVTGKPNEKQPAKRQRSPKQLAQIKERLLTSQWKTLRLELEKKHGLTISSNSGSNTSSGASGQSIGTPKEGTGKKFPGKITATVLDPRQFLPEPGVGIFATPLHSKHPLSNCTLLDNCGATHLVNDKALLVEGSLVKSSLGDEVESGTQILPVLGRGRRLFKNALHGENGRFTEDLELVDVAVVEDFHVNIIAEAALLKKGIWCSGYDATLRFGPVEESVVVRELERKFNIVFFEYKPLSNYLKLPHEVPISAPVLVYPALERELHRRFRRSRDYLKPRIDSEDVWHARAGHLGPEALRALVQHARNVHISGTPRLKCSFCATTHAKQVVSRRTSERKSPRPFFRVSWDLFDFPGAYNGAQFLLIIKDEFSRKFFGFILNSKHQINVFNSIKHFDTWVKRQFGLTICKIRQDNDTSMIALKGVSNYEIWAEEEGIELELAPTYTHEPNGGSERAGQEVITKSIKMREAAGLPLNLWSETTLAAIYLHNMSPLQSNAFRSPNEVLDAWFRSYFRWYDPALILRMTVDLRPDWNGIYAYGCRAYALMKAREQDKDKRDFKVAPRGHIGYLVGYVASNIYRIWVPQLERVIVTRNVIFDEAVFYSKTLEAQEGQPVPIARTIVEQIEEDENQSLMEVFASLWDEEEGSTGAPKSDVQALGGAAGAVNDPELSIQAPGS